ncbi:MAG: hypothetical protein R3B07_37545, partial [Polyangiaceae bacterium]
MTLTPTLRTLGYCVFCASLALGCGGSSSGSTEQTSAGGSGGSAGSQSDGGVAGNGGSSGGVGGTSGVGGSGGSGSGAGGSGGMSGAAGSGGSAGSDEQQALYDALTATADAYCGRLDQCCELKNLGYDEAACRATILGARDAAVDEGPDKLALGLSLDRDQLAQCVSDAADAAHVCEARFPASCNHYWKGQLQTGDACEDQDQCAAQSPARVACEYVQGQKVCTAKTHAGEGEACEWTCTTSGSGQVSCETSVAISSRQGQCFKSEGLHCKKGVCAADLPVGSTCLGQECKLGLHCEANKCTPDDAACGGDGITPACDEAYCDSSGACVGLVENGVSCTYDYECL